MAFQKKVYHKEENCLNCNYPLIGQYCGNCGQKAFLHKDSIGHMLGHFIGDYFHYDNKFWTTIKTLVCKPGLATLEYIHGKRAKFLNPIQLYIFVTTVFFIIAFSTNSIKDKEIDTATEKNVSELLKEKEELVQDNIEKEKTSNVTFNNGSIESNMNLNKLSNDIHSLTSYDSIQNALPICERDNYLKRLFYRRIIVLSERYKGDEVNTKFQEVFKKSLPKVFFILLPFFAFLLWLFYRRKDFYFVDHLIFSLHFHSYSFLILSCMFLLQALPIANNLDQVISIVGFIYIGIYLYFSLKRVYEKGRLSTFLKQVVLFFSYFIGFLFTAIMLVAYVFFTI
jgi:hypothetical protein